MYKIPKSVISKTYNMTYENLQICDPKNKYDTRQLPYILYVLSSGQNTLFPLKTI